LKEETLNAYINEAIKQELEEGLFTKAGTKAATKAATKSAAKQSARKLGQAAGGDAARMSRTKTPLKFAKNTKTAKNARLGLRDFRRGKAVEGKVGNTSYFARQENGVTKFYSDAACKNEITDPKLLKSVKSSWNSIVSHAKNVRNSARRNMLGTAAAAGLGAGWAIDHNAHKNDPWNGTPDGQSGDNGDGNRNNGGNWDGSFPWDNTKPNWTPRQPKNPAPATPTGATQPTKPTQPERPKFEPLPAVNTQLNLPGATTSAGTTIKRPEPQLTLPQNALRTMVNTTQASPAVASQREKNRALKQTRDNVVNAINSDSYGADKATKRADTKFVNDMYRTMKRGDQHPNL